MDYSDDEYTQFLRQVRARYSHSAYEQRARELGMPYADLTKFKPGIEALAMIPRTIAERYNVLPLKQDGNRLWVAISDPNDLDTMDSIRLVTHCTIRPVVAPPDAIQTAIARDYPSHGTLLEE